jgi:hypothetical protein
MANMVAARSAHDFEFFAQPHQKTFASATLATCISAQQITSASPTKKPALIAQVRAVKFKETLKYLKY